MPRGARAPAPGAGPRVGIVGGSRSDFPVLEKAKALLDELGIAKAYMDLYSRMLANPAVLTAFSANLMADYMHLWHSSWMKMMGMQALPTATPAKGDARFKDGKLVAMVHRSDIEIRDAHDVAEILTGLFDKHCAKASQN